MEDLEKYKLSYAQARDLAAKGRDCPAKVFYVVRRGAGAGATTEITEWVFDKETTLSKDYIDNILKIGPKGPMVGIRFYLSKSQWENPLCDAGFLNYFHAWGWLCLQEAKRRKKRKAV